jgi:ribosomal protein S18 acetylase RimI-like enzyme
MSDRIPHETTPPKNPLEKPLFVAEKVTLPELSEGDMTRIVQLYSQLSPERKLPEARAMEDMRRELQDIGSELFVIRDEHVVEGSRILAMARLQSTRTHAYQSDRDVDFMIFSLSVLPGHQRMGLARALLNACVDAIQKQGRVNRMLGLDVASDNWPARRIYEKFGFQTVYTYSNPRTFGKTYLRMTLPISRR